MLLNYHRQPCQNQTKTTDWRQFIESIVFGKRTIVTWEAEQCCANDEHWAGLQKYMRPQLLLVSGSQSFAQVWLTNIGRRTNGVDKSANEWKKCMRLAVWKICRKSILDSSGYFRCAPYAPSATAAAPDKPANRISDKLTPANFHNGNITGGGGGTCWAIDLDCCWHCGRFLLFHVNFTQLKLNMLSREKCENSPVKRT